MESRAAKVAVGEPTVTEMITPEAVIANVSTQYKNIKTIRTTTVKSRSGLRTSLADLHERVSEVGIRYLRAERVCPVCVT